MAEVRILPAARQRLLEIWDYTAEKWDESQADSYVKELVEYVESIFDERMTWRYVKEKRIKEVYFVRYRHHYLFFREFLNFIGVISIIHENMDIPNRLKEDISD